MSNIFEDDKEKALVKELAWKEFISFYTNPKLADKQDEMAIYAYITQKLAPFGENYQFEDLDKEEVRKWILARFPGKAESKRREIAYSDSDKETKQNEESTRKYIREHFQ